MTFQAPHLEKPSLRPAPGSGSQAGASCWGWVSVAWAERISQLAADGGAVGSHQAPGQPALQPPGPGPVKGVEDRAAGWAASPLSSRRPCMFPGPSPPLSFGAVSGFPQWQRGRWLDGGQGRAWRPAGWQGWNSRAALTREPASLALPTPQTPGFSADSRSSFRWIFGMLRTL